jgi:hypothetical protein
VKNKAVILILFVLFPLIVGLACTCGLLPIGGDKEEEPVEVIAPTEVVREIEAPEEVLPTEAVIPTEPDQEVVPTGDNLIIMKETWNTVEDQVYVGFLLKNQSPDLTLENVDYEIKLLDSSGQEIAQDWNSFPYLFPEQTLGIFYLGYLEEGDPPVANVDITYGFEETSAPDEYFNPLSSDKVKYWEGDFWPIVTGLINNTDQVTYTSVRASVLCYDAAGEIVGGGFTYTDFVPAQDQMGFHTFVDAFDTVASVEVFPVLSFSSTEYEDSDEFWGRTSIIEDNFYIGGSNQMYGGAVIQNNLTDQTLSNAMVSVTFLDEEGYVTNFGSQYLDFFLPGETIGLAPYVSSHTSDASPSNYTMFLLPGDIEENYELSSNVLRVNTAVLASDSKFNVIVNFTNTYSKQITDVSAFVLLYDANGNILGGGNASLSDPVPAGGTAEVEVYTFYDFESTVSRVDAWVVPNYWTVFE